MLSKLTVLSSSLTLYYSSKDSITLYYSSKDNFGRLAPIYKYWHPCSLL